jgi:S-methylmethionine-dependent homocysteine/selenocysteine methylase
VVETHCEYIRAGATVVETWNYSVTKYWLRAQPEHASKSDAELDLILEDLLARSVRLAKEARHECAASHVAIAGALPPLGASFDAADPIDLLTAEPVDVCGAYTQIAKVLDAEGCDFFLIETCAKVAFAKAALAACAAVNPEKEVWLSMTLKDDQPLICASHLSPRNASLGRAKCKRPAACRLPGADLMWGSCVSLGSGETVAELVSSFGSGGMKAPDAVLFNCSPVEVISQALIQLRTVYEGRTGGYANRRGARHRYGAEAAAAQKEIGSGEAVLGLREDLEPEAYAAWVSHSRSIRFCLLAIALLSLLPVMGCERANHLANRRVLCCAVLCCAGN